MINLDSILKSRDITNKGSYSQSYSFSSSHIWMWVLDYKESWALKNWCFWTVVLEKTFESPLDSKDVKPVNPKGNQPWIFIGRTDAEAPMLWSPDAKRQHIGKDPDAGKDWGQEEKGKTEDDMGGWHHWLIEREFEPALGVGDGQGGLACYSPRGRKESDVIEQLNWTDLKKGAGAQWRSVVCMHVNWSTVTEAHGSRWQWKEMSFCSAPSPAPRVLPCCL